jgi:hypothetical protein
MPSSGKLTVTHVKYYHYYCCYYILWSLGATQAMIMQFVRSSELAIIEAFGTASSQPLSNLEEVVAYLGT